MPEECHASLTNVGAKFLSDVIISDISVATDLYKLDLSSCILVTLGSYIGCWEETYESVKFLLRSRSFVNFISFLVDLSWYLLLILFYPKTPRPTIIPNPIIIYFYKSV